MTEIPLADNADGAMTCCVSYQGKGACSVSLLEVERRARHMLSEFCLTRATLSVVLCDDPIIKGLNARYRKKNRPTDVLSFSMLEGETIAGLGPILGDIIISVPTAIRQAAEREVAPLTEVTELLAHGLLHLLGFDHRTVFEERRMQAQVRYLTADL